MTINVYRRDHDRHFLRMRESRNGQPLPGPRPTLSNGRESGGSQLEHSRLGTVTATSARPSRLNAIGNPSLAVRARG